MFMTYPEIPSTEAITGLLLPCEWISLQLELTNRDALIQLILSESVALNVA